LAVEDAGNNDDDVRKGVVAVVLVSSFPDLVPITTPESLTDAKDCCEELTLLL
jgi:hypothetical protein